MTLTSEDITLIQQIARRVVEEALQKKSPKRSAEFTQVYEIRDFILDNLEELYEEFGVDKPFDVAVLRHWLCKRMEMKERDLETMADGGPRFYAQIANAIYPATWNGSESPIQSTSKRGFYVFRRQENTFTSLLDL